MNLYSQLTIELNAARFRAVLAGGQAVVLHRLAIMSKDGDWVLREDQETLDHVLMTLERHGATYRFGAPLDLRWLSEGWSSHLEFNSQGIRVRTDFVTRPPRMTEDRLAALWQDQTADSIPFLGLADLIETKKTNREKDYVVIGELARQLPTPREMILQSRSARDLLDLYARHPGDWPDLVGQRPTLAAARDGLEALETALDKERRTLIRANETRLGRFLSSAEGWARLWPEVSRDLSGLPLLDAHRLMVGRALGILPFRAK